MYRGDITAGTTSHDGIPGQSGSYGQNNQRWMAVYRYFTEEWAALVCRCIQVTVHPSV